MHWDVIVWSRVEYDERIQRALEEGRIRRLRAQRRPGVSPARLLLSRLGQGLEAWGLWLQAQASPGLPVQPHRLSRQNG